MKEFWNKILAFIKNEGCNNFIGTMTATLVNTNDERDIKTIDDLDFE